MQDTISKELHEKADRLVRTGKVHRVGNGLQFVVQGDTASYAVHLSWPREASGRCDCPANRNNPHKRCSHIVAASIYCLAEEDSIKPDVTDIESKRDPFRDLAI